jgi:hypothetical protein
MTDSDTDPMADDERLRGDAGDRSPGPLHRPAGVAVGGSAAILFGPAAGESAAAPLGPAAGESAAAPFGPAVGQPTRGSAPGSALTIVGNRDYVSTQ